MTASTAETIATETAVIGAGVAGVSAARALVAAGRRVTLVDKARRAGGRCATRRVAKDPDSAWFDYGAQYFTARDPAFRQAIAADIEAGELVDWRPAVGVAEASPAGWRIAPSPDDRPRLIGRGGLNHWLRARLAALAVDVVCGARASAVARRGAGWQIAAGERTIVADRLILTPPPAQTTALLADRAAAIEVLHNADARMRACHSLVVAAPALADFQALFVHGGRLSWIADNSHKAGATAAARRLWTLHATPDFSDDNVDAAPADLAPALIAEFTAITGLATGDVERVHGHRWRYARNSEAAPDPAALCWADPGAGLALAGDWLAGGRVEGAWRSGRAAAAALLGAG